MPNAFAKCGVHPPLLGVTFSGMVQNPEPQGGVLVFAMFSGGVVCEFIFKKFKASQNVFVFHVFPILQNCEGRLF